MTPFVHFVNFYGTLFALCGLSSKASLSYILIQPVSPTSVGMNGSSLLFCLQWWWHLLGHWYYLRQRFSLYIIQLAGICVQSTCLL